MRVKSPESGVDTDITALVQSAGSGDAAARDALFALLYDELKRIARKQLRGASSLTLDANACACSISVPILSRTPVEPHRFCPSLPPAKEP